MQAKRVKCTCNCHWKWHQVFNCRICCASIWYILIVDFHSRNDQHQKRALEYTCCWVQSLVSIFFRHLLRWPFVHCSRQDPSLESHHPKTKYNSNMLCKRALRSSLWRHNGRGGVSRNQLHDGLLNIHSGADQRKLQSSASLAFVRGIHRWPVNSPY